MAFTTDVSAVNPNAYDFVVAPNLEALVLGNSILPLEHVPYIYYLFRFKKDQTII